MTAEDRREAVARRLRTNAGATSAFSVSYGSRKTAEPTETLSIRFPRSLLDRVAEYSNQQDPPLNLSDTIRTLVTHALDTHDGSDHG